MRKMKPRESHNQEAQSVRKHNVVLYKKNWYTVPEGTYQGRGTNHANWGIDYSRKIAG